jgi:hypothetical protein
MDLVEHRISDHLGAADRNRSRERDVARLVQEWPDLPFAERRNVLRDAVARVTVTDDSIDVMLRA